MIVADTNVWSEAVRRTPEPRVMAWMLEHRAELALTTVSIGELLYGLEILPEGRRRTALTTEIEQLITGATSRTYAYDAAAAREFARIRAARRRAGREVVKPEDAMIAAIAAAHDSPVATRDLAGFEDMGVEIIDPWSLDAS